MWTTESPGIEIAHAHSADEFIYILRRSNSCWWEGGMPWAFRGHSEPLTVDSEHFRSAPRTCRSLGGKLKVR
jgi:hypothetical protein